MSHLPTPSHPRVPTYALLLFLAVPAVVRAGTFVGTVADSTTGAAVEGAAVHAVTEGGSPVALAPTDAAGRFRIAGLAAGRYFLVAARIGMERRRTGPHAVADGETVRVDIRLAPGPAGWAVSSRRPAGRAGARPPASVSVVGRAISAPA
jgi:hypothetical protein